MTLLQFKCFLRCKDWEKLKLILSLLVRGRERKEKGREGKEKGENIREGIVPQFCAPKKHELLLCHWYAKFSQINGRGPLGLQICGTSIMTKKRKWLEKKRTEKNEVVEIRLQFFFNKRLSVKKNLVSEINKLKYINLKNNLFYR